MLMVWSYLKRWGLPVLRQFNQAVPVLVLLGVVFLLIAIWWLGPQWTWRERQPLSEWAMRVSASVVVLVVPLLIWAWRVRNRYQRLQVERQHEAAVQADVCLTSRRRSARWTAAWAICSTTWSAAVRSINCRGTWYWVRKMPARPA